MKAWHTKNKHQISIEGIYETTMNSLINSLNKKKGGNKPEYSLNSYRWGPYLIHTPRLCPNMALRLTSELSYFFLHDFNGTIRNGKIRHNLVYGSDSRNS
jgi:hypothetical protein